MLIVAITVAIVASGYVAMILVLWRYQERIVFQPPAFPVAERASGILQLSYAAADGVSLFAHIIGDPTTAGPVILAFHGNAVVARWLIPWAREAASRFDSVVVLAEYRGYDGIRGRPTYESSALDARAALDATCEHFRVRPESVTLYGHSLGTAVAGELASSTPVRSLILQSPFSSARDMAARWRIVGLLRLWSTISRVHFDTRERVAVLETPVHVAHGERDIVVPARMGRDVFSAARRPGRLLVVPSAGHNDVPESGGAAYWEWLGEAIRAEAR